ncbi:SDR family NAD(P)-dependent oxidoreductase [Actinomycetospora sp. TBRC 11914]|uniref:SDR family NAD(P)-dependent oxidoreductase n=1 Tax=Actinomycetospora sp. TBRC 11914 TaxID=2729387 RepID=UPI00145E8DA6|nr:SDR family NAD(P)-dependent oxidoreductase [Actinomycetospora sp. TBRC 11914]NMO92085.1 SDR family oxidoreductase [Actinomycetospora sp. TBRC 11914]
MTDRFAGKVVLVTGAGSGIGQAAALRFAAEGASVAVLDVRPEGAALTTMLVEKEHEGRALALCADVADADEVTTAVDLAVAELGRLDAVYNNAGTMDLGSVEDTPEDTWDRTFGVHARGTYLTSRAALEHLGPGGAIVNQGSIAALVGVQYLAAYSAAKGAVVALTRAMAVDLAPRGIRVNAICPGTCRTPMTEPLFRARGEGDPEAGVAQTLPKYPLGRLGTPEDIAAVAAFLASDEASFMTGSVVTSDGGMTAQ